MSSNNKQTQKNQEATKSFDVYESTKSLSEAELHDLLQTVLQKNPGAGKTALEWFRKKSEKSIEIDQQQVKSTFNEVLLWECWCNVQPIISEFNECGGGPYEEKDACCDYLSELEKLAEANEINTETKKELLEEIFLEYNVANSGFEDSLMNICFALCKTREEWQYLVKKLEEQPGKWRNDLIMGIRKNQLQDDEAYLKMRKEELEYGMDYWDLVDYYNKKGNRALAVETAETGLKNGKGRLTELIHFLFDHYAVIKDTQNVERIVQFCIEKKQDKSKILDKQFKYYKSRNDYKNAKKALLKAFEYVQGPDFREEEGESKVKDAAEALYPEYSTDKELTVFTDLDFEGFYETR